MVVLVKICCPECSTEYLLEEAPCVIICNCNATTTRGSMYINDRASKVLIEKVIPYKLKKRAQRDGFSSSSTEKSLRLAKALREKYVVDELFEVYDREVVDLLANNGIVLTIFQYIRPEGRVNYQYRVLLSPTGSDFDYDGAIEEASDTQFPYQNLIFDFNQIYISELWGFVDTCLYCFFFFWVSLFRWVNSLRIMRSISS